MVASASAVAERSKHSRKRRLQPWFTIASAIFIAVVVVLIQFKDIRSYVNATGKRRTKGRSSSSSGGRQMSNNRQGHSSGANGVTAIGDSTTHYTRIMYESEMNAVVRSILAPADEEFGPYQQPGLSQGLSMMNRDMLRGLKRQVEAVVDADIDGDVYEFGSWRGGASILMARVFDAYERYRNGNNEGSSTGTNSSSNDAAIHDENYRTKRMFYVFDTFDGFLDQQVRNDTLLQELLLDKYWVAPLDNVRRSFIKLTSQGFVDSNVRFVPGLFEDTVPLFASNGGPNRGNIALLRLDGDLYESTRVVLEHMYDHVEVGGHVIVDDYDWRPEKWAKGGDQTETKTDRKICKEAVDEFRLERNVQSPITREYARPSWTKEAGEEEEVQSDTVAMLIKNDTSPIVFVHLGKTAGSTITCQLSPAVWNSGKGDSGCGGADASGATSSNASSEIVRRVVERVHLEPAPVDGPYHNFLVTARNPIDRVISGFYYIHPYYPPVKKARHKRYCQNFALFECWNTIQSLAEDGLSLPMRTSNHLHSTKQTDEECRAWAWDYVRGTRHCFHNYWNYNRTYGNLLDQHEQRKAHSTKGNSPERNQIFVIRSEHAVDDWNNIDKLLGGTAMTGTFDETKNNFTDSIAHGPNQTLSLDGRQNLCRALCDEIQLYKRLLNSAANLDTKMKKTSVDELLRSCPNEVREVQDCSRL